MYLHYTPRLLHWLYPALRWHMPRTQKVLYLTFDDGPIPEVTPAVLEILAQWNAKATFFCVGDNVCRHPEVLEKVVEKGHRLGNHTFNHLKGSSTSTKAYLENVAACQQLLSQYSSHQQQQFLFRPPYGRFTRPQRQMLQQDYTVVMWDVLSADFDPKLTAKACLQKSIQYSRPGSIIVFHDSLKAWRKLQWVLPRYLDYFSQRGFTFAAL